MSATPRNGFLAEPDRRPGMWLAGLVEVAASLLALYSMGALLMNKADSMIAFFGETPAVSPENISTYQLWLSILVVAIGFSFGAALWRRGLTGRSSYWHGFVLLAGLTSAVAFHVTVPSPAHDPDLNPVQDRPGSLCYSGGDDTGCVGG